MIDILMIDNYDSFTYNLFHLFLKFDARISVKRNDVIDSKGVLEISPDIVVISPGPKNPAESGNTKEIIAGIVIMMGSFVIDGSLSERFRKAAYE